MKAGILNKMKMKKVLSTLFLGALLLGFSTNVFASDPAFNNLQGDLELLRGRNVTDNASADWTDPVAGDANDEIEGLVYFHNTVEGSTALNTRITVTLPTELKTQHVLNARLSADNATSISDILTVNASSATRVEFVPGSVKLYPNGSQTPVALPNGQTGAELISATGLNIGDLQGCWAFQGYLSFKVKLVAPQSNPQLAIVKDAHVGAGHTPFGNMWADQVNSAVNDDVHFRMTITNPGQNALEQVRLIDQLPAGLTYVAGSAMVYADDNATGTALTGDLTSGFNLGALHPVSGTGTPKKLTVVFASKVTGTYQCGDTTLINTATVTSGALTATDTARVIVKVICQGQPNIEKHKSAYNETQKLDATKVTAKPGDVITYTLVTKNIGSAASTNFVIEDGIRDILDYADVTAISENGLRVENAGAGNRDDQVLVRYPGVTIDPGQAVNRTFTVKVKNPLPADAQSGTAFDLVMFNQYGDKVVIVIEKPAVNAMIIKNVRNITRNETDFKDKTRANPGQVVEYEVKVKNIGNVAFTGKVSDVLPNGASFIAGSVVIHSGTIAVTDQNILFGEGFTISNLAVQAEARLTFRATLANNLANDTQLTNVAKVVFTGGEREAKALVIIEVPQVVAATPVITQAPPAVTTQPLPKAGANPFGLMFVLAGSVYTGWTRRSMNKKMSRLSDYIEVI